MPIYAALKQKFFLVLDNTENNISCLLGTGPPAKKKRKKRNVDGEVKEKKHARECPADFKKVTTKMCLHYSDGDRTFQASKEYCENKTNDTHLISFANSSETLEVYNWLGKYEHVCHNHIGFE